MTRISRRYVDHRVTGTWPEVAARVALLRDSGQLVAMTPPRQMGDDDPRVWVHVRLAARPGPVQVAQRRRWPLVTAVGAAGAAVLGAAVWAVVQLVHALVALLPVIVVGLALLALAVAAVGDRCHITVTHRRG